MVAHISAQTLNADLQPHSMDVNRSSRVLSMGSAELRTALPRKVGFHRTLGFSMLLKKWSGRPGSNRRRPAWEAGILPLNYSRSGSVMSIPKNSGFCESPMANPPLPAASASTLSRHPGRPWPRLRSPLATGACGLHLPRTWSVARAACRDCQDRLLTT